MKKKTIAALAAGGALLLAAVVIGVLSLVRGYFILLPPTHMQLNGRTEEHISAFAAYTDPGFKQFLQHGSGVRKRTRLRLQQMRLERQVTQLLRHRIVQFTGQSSVLERGLFALLLTTVAAQAYGNADRMRCLF